MGSGEKEEEERSLEACVWELQKSLQALIKHYNGVGLEISIWLGASLVQMSAAAAAAAARAASQQEALAALAAVVYL